MVGTDDGKKIGAGFCFRSIGSRANTTYLTDSRLVDLTADGFVPVTYWLMVIGYDNVYALGHMTDPDPNGHLAANARRRRGGQPSRAIAGPP